MTAPRACDRCIGTDAALECAAGHCLAEEFDEQEDRRAHGLAEQARWERGFYGDQRLMVDP